MGMKNEKIKIRYENPQNTKTPEPQQRTQGTMPHLHSISRTDESRRDPSPLGPEHTDGRPPNALQILLVWPTWLPFFMLALPCPVCLPHPLSPCLVSL